jgi:hypothetical protein
MNQCNLQSLNRGQNLLSDALIILFLGGSLKVEIFQRLICFIHGIKTINNKNNLPPNSCLTLWQEQSLYQYIVEFQLKTKNLLPYPPFFPDF